MTRIFDTGALALGSFLTGVFLELAMPRMEAAEAAAIFLPFFLAAFFLAGALAGAAFLAAGFLAGAFLAFGAAFFAALGAAFLAAFFAVSSLLPRFKSVWFIGFYAKGLGNLSKDYRIATKK